VSDNEETECISDFVARTMDLRVGGNNCVAVVTVGRALY
jgi:hypothetical protein